MVRYVGVALLVLLAGCQGFTAGSTPAESTADAPPGATVTNTVGYEDLSPGAQRAFDAAVDGQAKFFAESDSEYVDGPYFDPATAEPFRDYEFVRKNRTYYRLSGRFGRLYASYRIRALPAPVPTNATVTSLSALNASLRNPVRWAIENGTYNVPLGKWGSVPGDRRPEYVRYSNETYRVGILAGDAWVEVWEAEPVD